MTKTLGFIPLLYAFLLALLPLSTYSKINTDNTPIDSMGTLLSNAVITGTRNPTDESKLTQTITNVSHETLTEAERLNLLPTLSEQIPSLFVTQRGIMGFGVSDGAAGGINIRGLNSGSGRVMVLIDGHPQYQGIFGHPISDSYQTLLAERIEVLRGPSSMLYGSNAMAGVINILTRQSNENGINTAIQLAGGSYGTYQIEATNRIRHNKFSSVVALQYAHSNNHRPSMGFTQYGGYAKLGYDFSAKWNTYIDINLTHFAASYPGSIDTPIYGAKQWINRGVASFVIENHYEKSSGALSLYHNFGRHKINDGYEESEEIPTSLFRSNDALTGFNWYQSTSLFAGNCFTLGIDYQHIYGKAWNDNLSDDEESSLIGKEKEDEVAFYADFRQNIVDWMTIDVGVRYDHHSQSGNEWIPQGGIVFQVIPQGELRATVSKGFRYPTIREMYFWRPANDELVSERAINYEMAWSQYLLDGKLHYGTNIFLLNAKNLIQTQMVDGRPKNVNTGETKNIGIEAQLAYRINNTWNINTNYSYLHMSNALVGSPEHKAYFNCTYSKKQWKVLIGLQYIHGLYTQTGTEEKQENFLLLNASIHYSPTRLVSLWIKGENLLAQRYEINAGYPMPKATVMAGINLHF